MVMGSLGCGIRCLTLWVGFMPRAGLVWDVPHVADPGCLEEQYGTVSYGTRVQVPYVYIGYRYGIIASRPLFSSKVQIVLFSTLDTLSGDFRIK